MAKLIILNGPSGVGKSTIAARLHADIPNSELVDVDELRRSVPNYKEQRKESLLRSYQMAKEAIEDGLGKDRSVIIDKGISYQDTLDSLIVVGKKYEAEIYEILLFADKQTVRRRADERGYIPGSLLTRERVGELWDQMDELRKQRPKAMVIDTSDLSLMDVYQKIKEIISF